MKKFVAFGLLFIMLGGCSRTDSFLPTGKGSFVFQNDQLNYGRGLTVFTYKPASFTADSPILFVIHGNSRTAEKYREAWIPIADQYNALLLCPHFSRENGFPTDQQFNMGNLFQMDSLDRIIAPNREEDWAYSLIDPIFDFVVQKTGSHAKGYLIYGHSAGSQFVHRFLLFKPQARARHAVFANAGWYTFPDTTIEFPYGLKGAPWSQESLKAFLSRKVTVLLGEADTDTAHKSLRRTPEAMRQGKHRFERGQNFFAFCRQLAADLHVPFNWQLKTVPGVAHSNAGMAPAAGEALFGGNP